MLAAGCAVGLGNVWRFPFVVGQNGGAAFVLVYLLFLAILGFPMLTAELALGRAARQGVSGALRNLAAERYRRFWSVTGCLIFAGNFLLMIYYTDVAGWLLKYSGDYLRGLPPPDFSALLKDHATCSGYLPGFRVQKHEKSRREKRLRRGGRAFPGKSTRHTADLQEKCVLRAASL